MRGDPYITEDMLACRRAVRRRKEAWWMLLGCALVIAGGVAVGVLSWS